MKILVVGAGLSGSVVARELAELGYRVTIVEKNSHIGGNCYDEVNSFGIRVHKYGPHLFHTKNKVVFDWLCKFTVWVEYKHKVKALLKNGICVTLPVNNETKNIVGEGNILDIFYRPYTKKMWGIDLEELNPNIIKRVPIRDDNNEYYFPDDTYQGIPIHGYTKLIENIISHPNIEVFLSTEFNKNMEKNYFHIFNSMPIDQYFNYKNGRLPYRSIIFEEITLPLPSILPTATLNFTHNGQHTRVTEWKKIPSHGENDYFSTLTFERPCDYLENNEQRFYPINDLAGKNRLLYNSYKSLISENTKVTFIGRLGLYTYIDMDQAVNIALETVKNFIKKTK
jgi:UDP-galactopyranose mutase